MHLDINKHLLIFIGWLIRAGYQLECVQCTSPIKRVSQEEWDHTCLDGTLLALPCLEPVNSSTPPFKQCISSLYRLGNRENAGIFIYRGCTTTDRVQHDCDPPHSSKNFGKTNFFCSRTCSDDGCNRHSVKEISSNANELLNFQFFILHFCCIIYLVYFECNLFS